MANIFFGIGLLALSLSCIFISLSLRNLEKRISKLQDTTLENVENLNSIHRTLRSYYYRFTSSNDEYVDYEVCQHWRTMPTYKIDLRDFLPGDKIVFKASEYGFSTFEIVRSCNPQVKEK